MNQSPDQPSATFMDRWETLKPVIEKLWLIDKKRLADVARTMKDEHNFTAFDHQYTYQFKKWKWKRSVPEATKKEIAQQLQSRALTSNPSTTIIWDGKEVEMRKVRRYMKKKAREDSQTTNSKSPSIGAAFIPGPVLPFSNNFFLKWNMPYAAMQKSLMKSYDHAVTQGFANHTPETDNIFAGPSSTVTQWTAASSSIASIKRNMVVERGHMFAQGRHEKLLMSLDSEERRIMCDWLYQYWFFGFKTAKDCGTSRGLQAWTAELLNFDFSKHPNARNLTDVPGELMSSLEVQRIRPPTPTGMCRWFIHVRAGHNAEQIYEAEAGYARSPLAQELWQEQSLPVRLRDGLERNDFSSIPTETLPVAIPQTARAAKRCPDEFLLESLGFSIMSRNLLQVEAILYQLVTEKVDLSSLYPLHMASSYIDGHKTCCSIFTVLLKGTPNLRAMLVNELGHTVLDNLMISVFKSHSSAAPTICDDKLRNTCRFSGEEVDICGRWDADSPCIRHLYGSGTPSIPFGWKHKFCHTSIQTICHCIISMQNHAPLALHNGAASGLYVRHCYVCGTKLQLQPLHALVMTAYHLASKGCEDEDLFGMVALLLCMMSTGFDPRTKADISVVSLLQTDAMEIGCDHEKLTPAEFAEELSRYSSLWCSWNSKTRLGWEVFCGILRLCEDAHVIGEFDEDYLDNDRDCASEFFGTHEPTYKHVEIHLDIHHLVNAFRVRKDLATLWASVQAELLAYRRIDDSMSWTSWLFSMEGLRDQLKRREPLSVGYSEHDLLRTHCICGEFDNQFKCPPTLSDATNPDIANLDIWDRAAYGLLNEAY